MFCFVLCLVKGLCLAFLGLLCKFFPEHMRKYADPLLLGQYLKYLHEQLVKDVVKFEMLIAAGAIEGLVNYLVNFTPSAIPGKNKARNSVFLLNFLYS